MTAAGPGSSDGHVTSDFPVPADSGSERGRRTPRLVLGAAGNVADLVEHAVRIALAAPAEAGPRSALLGVPDTLIGFGLDAGRRVTAIAGRARLGRPGLRLPRLPERARRQLESWSEQGRAVRLRSEREAGTAGRELMDALVGAVLDRIDLDAVVARVDPNRVAERVDVDSVVDRVDIAAIVDQVLREVDIPTLVRDSGGTMTQESIDAFREQTMRADRFVDRIAGRRGARDRR